MSAEAIEILSGLALAGGRSQKGIAWPYKSYDGPVIPAVS
jgi:hypothetical protein